MAYTPLGRIRPNYRGVWSSATAYSVMDVVQNTARSACYQCIKDAPAGTPLTNTLYFALMVSAEAMKGEKGDPGPRGETGPKGEMGNPDQVNEIYDFRTPFGSAFDIVSTPDPDKMLYEYSDENLVLHKALNNDGSYADASNRAITRQLIPVETGVTYYCMSYYRDIPSGGTPSLKTIPQWGLYDADGKFVKRIDWVNTYTAEEGIAYVRLVVSYQEYYGENAIAVTILTVPPNNGVDKWKFGTAIQYLYSPAFSGHFYAEINHRVTTGENVSNLAATVTSEKTVNDMVIDCDPNRMLYDWNDDNFVMGYKIDADGSVAAQVNRKYSRYLIPVTAGVTYYAFRYPEGAAGDSTPNLQTIPYWAAYDAQGRFLRTTAQWQNRYTAQEGDAYIRFVLSTPDQTSAGVKFVTSVTTIAPNNGDSGWAYGFAAKIPYTPLVSGNVLNTAKNDIIIPAEWEQGGISTTGVYGSAGRIRWKDWMEFDRYAGLKIRMRAIPPCGIYTLDKAPDGTITPVLWQYGGDNDTEVLEIPVGIGHQYRAAVYRAGGITPEEAGAVFRGVIAGEAVSSAEQGAAIEKLRNDHEITEAWSNRVEDVLKAKGKGFCFVAQTDTHFDFDNSGGNHISFPRSANEFRNFAALVHADLAVHLGDIIRGYNTDTTEDMRKDMTEAVRRYTSGTAIPMVFAVGNHDNCCQCSGDTMTRDEMYARLVAPARNMLCWRMSAGRKTYYYADFDDVRVIVLNTSDTDEDTQFNYTISQEQVSWFASEALNTSKPVIVMSHIPLCDAFTVDVPANADGIMNALKAFRGDIVGCISGHVHDAFGLKAVDGITHCSLDWTAAIGEAFVVNTAERTVHTFVLGKTQARNVDREWTY